MTDFRENYGEPAKNARRLVKSAGYAMGGGIKSKPKAPVEPKTKLKSGGGIKGDAAASRPDKRARGGKIGTVNVTVKSGEQDPQAAQASQQMAAKEGLQKGVMLGAQMAKNSPPPGPGGPGPGMPPPGGPGPGMPPGGMPMLPPGRKSGGSVPHMTASAAGGLGRLEKAGMVKVKAHQRRRGGACS